MLRTLSLALLATLVLGAAQLQAQLITQPTALRYGLDRAWYAQVHLDPSQGKLSHMVLDVRPENTNLLVVQTTVGLAQALDAETGRLLWSVQLGLPGNPSGQPAVNDRYVAVAFGDNLHLLVRNTGRKIWEKKLPMTVGGGLALSADRVFITLSNGWIQSYSLEDPDVGDWHYASRGLVGAPILTRDGICWTNDRGMLYGSGFDTNRLSFQFETDAKASAPLGYMVPNVYMGMDDGNVYAVRTERGRRLGKVAWRYYTGGMIHSAPAPVDDQLYVATVDNGMYCLDIKVEVTTDEAQQAAADAKKEYVPKVADRSGGVALWWAEGARKFISASAKRVYTEDRRGNVLILDRKAGTVLGRLPLAGNMRTVSNIRSDRLYVATDAGLIQCLHERGQDQPLVHLWPDEIKEERVINRNPGAGAAKAGDAKPDDANN